MIRGALKKVGEFAQKEARTALPAAGRAAVYGVKEFLKKLPEEYAKERKKR
jgi:hypothetical protein